MDQYMFEEHLKQTVSVVETTTYVEIFQYSDPSLNTVAEHPLKSPDDFSNFLHQRGAFAYEPPRYAPDAGSREIPKLVSSFRMVLQAHASEDETFSPHYISLTASAYREMIEAMHLPYRGIESSSAVGPFFWCALDQDEENPRIQILFRKSDVRKKNKTRGWELMLCHDTKANATTAFCKGTVSSDILESVRHLKACVQEIGHPMLLPTIIFSHDMSEKTDIKQREARDWIRKLEHAVSMRTEIEEKDSYLDKDGLVDFDLINRHLVECHSQVLWKRPKAYMQIIDGFRDAMALFKATTIEQDTLNPDLSSFRWNTDMRKQHGAMLSRHEFYRKKLQGIDSYAFTTLQRLEIQRDALYNVIQQRESKLNFQMARDQRKLAHASKRDSGAQKTIALLGALFLPGAFLASIFSTSFFNFQNGLADDGGNDMPIVAKEFWIFWVFTLPITVVVVAGWVYWEKRKESRYKVEDEELAQDVDKMEMDIQKQMRQRIMSKAGTWDTKVINGFGKGGERGEKKEG